MKKPKIPIYVKKVMQELENSDFEAFVVGGCVRDFFLEKNPLDWDICTNATPENMLEIFRDKFHLILTGIKHGTITVVSDENFVEVTTYRCDGIYSDTRHPQSVEFISSLKEDMARRDFTINAIAYNEKTGFMDFFNGIDDIKKGILRTVGNPSHRFSEDALRILRALRFASVCDFKIEPETKKAIHSLKGLIKNIAIERITLEFKKILLSKTPSKILNEYSDVFEIIIPEVFSNNLSIDHIDILEKDMILRLSALLLNTNNPQEIMQRLKLDKASIKTVTILTKNANIKLPTDKISLKKMLNKFGAEILNYIIALQSHKISIENKNIYKNIISDILTNKECYSLDTLCINGNDLIKLGFKEGKTISTVLNFLLNEVIEEKIKNNKKTLINYAKAMLHKSIAEN